MVSDVNPPKKQLSQWESSLESVQAPLAFVTLLLHV
jgi:hypothetical protein